ncbi:MAG TPA: glycosyl hydrolase family 8 [Solirubrobacterales bacterium]|nr:glycosyl hydrolase family 8 [Solirubrobacterales bacterium]
MTLGLPQPAPERRRPTAVGFRRRGLLAAAAVAGVAAVLAVVLLLRGGGGDDGGRSEASAAAAADAFLTRYVEPDGRVSRRDQGGDTVSEGQAYAMLLAADQGRGRTFARVWGWTRENLRRPDGLLAWHWAGGEVVDPHSAADGDLDAAWALLLGARRFGAPAYRAEGLKLGSAILEHETVSLDGRSLLVAGDWATRFPAVVDPSYFSPAAFAALGRASGDPRWGELAATGREVLAQVSEAPSGLAPDWATVEADGHAVPSPPPGEAGGEAAFGYDAVRVPLWQGAGCEAEARELAARPAHFLAEAMAGPSPASTYALDGEPRGGEAGAPVLVATAAAVAASESGGGTAARGGGGATAEVDGGGAARAEGGEAAARGGGTAAGSAAAWLDRAAAADQAQPTYYGGALVALGRAALEPGGGLGC